MKMNDSKSDDINSFARLNMLDKKDLSIFQKSLPSLHSKMLSRILEMNWSLLRNVKNKEYKKFLKNLLYLCTTQPLKSLNDNLRIQRNFKEKYKIHIRVVMFIPFQEQQTYVWSLRICKTLKISLKSDNITLYYFLYFTPF